MSNSMVSIASIVSQKDNTNTNAIESLEKYIEKWIAVDNQLQILQEKMKTMREWKKRLTDTILPLLIEKKGDNAVIELPDGELKIQEKQEYSALSFSYIEDCLSELIPDEEQVEYVMDFLRENRESRTVTEIKRKKRNTTNPV